jgi:hypothetical protein
MQLYKLRLGIHVRLAREPLLCLVKSYCAILLGAFGVIVIMRHSQIGTLPLLLACSARLSRLSGGHQLNCGRQEGRQDNDARAWD